MGKIRICHGDSKTQEEVASEHIVDLFKATSPEEEEILANSCKPKGFPHPHRLDQTSLLTSVATGYYFTELTDFRWGAVIKRSGEGDLLLFTDAAEAITRGADALSIIIRGFAESWGLGNLPGCVKVSMRKASSCLQKHWWWTEILGKGLCKKSEHGQRDTFPLADESRRPQRSSVGGAPLLGKIKCAPADSKSPALDCWGGTLLYMAGVKSPPLREISDPKASPDDDSRMVSTPRGKYGKTKPLPSASRHPSQKDVGGNSLVQETPAHCFASFISRCVNSLVGYACATVFVLLHPGLTSLL
ncbi:hypothetical protein NQZ68_013297 [Dissostichus eleginoides]|nr:hypothetical protein NQZ68_013297 [Dissostichus eleginoides]